MPLFLNPKHAGRERRAGLDWPRVPPGDIDSSRGDVLHIGLVNNMGDAAMIATERQFLSLLDAAAGDMRVHVTLYALPEVERKPTSQRRVNSFYFGIDNLWEQSPELRPDGLIVTGREPATPDLRQETYWPSFERVLAWTREHRRSAVWSCLAAHAAVLALDGIERVRSPHKHFGILTCRQTTVHALLAGASPRLRFPHSRWNGVSADQLAANGYQVLARTADDGVDLFVKNEAGLCVFVQGHPEYDAETLLREYRRDAARYLKGEMETYPLLPTDYFEREVERSLLEIEAKARASRQESLLLELSAVLSSARIENTWRDAAILIYSNWLRHLSMQKHNGAGSSSVGADRQIGEELLEGVLREEITA